MKWISKIKNIVKSISKSIWRWICKHKKNLKYFGLMILLVVAVFFLGAAGSLYLVLALLLFFAIRFIRRRDVWWHPFRDTIEYELYGCRYADLTKEEKEQWKRSKKQITWKGKKLFKVPSLYGKNPKN